MVTKKQAAPLGLFQLAADGKQRQAGALLEQHAVEAFVQPQRIHHELETQFNAADFVFGLYRRVLGDLLHIRLRLLIARLAYYLIGKTQLAVRARADAQIIAELPVTARVVSAASRLRA